ncbi:hypothetical protein AAC387_Pa06g0046 [Persea americana]
MLPFSPIVSNQIRYLLQIANDSNFDSVFRELSQFVEYGNEGSILLLQTCLDEVDFHGGDAENIQLKQNLFAEIFRYSMERPNFTTVFCEALRSTPSEEFLGDLSKALHLSTSEKIAVGLALSDSENLDFRMRGQNFCMTQIEELCENPTSEVSHDQIQNILKESAPLLLAPVLIGDLSEVDSMRHSDQFFECTQNDFEAILAEMEKDISMADIMMELGYGCTVNSSQCKEILSLFLPLDEVTLSRILGTIVRTHTGLEDSQNTYSTFCSALGSSSATDSSWLSSWNADVLVDSIKQLAPQTNWTRVVENLDHEGFYFPDEEAFYLFMSIYRNACQDSFPLHAICGSIWKNAEGQLSFLRYAVSAPPEIFTFSHSARQMSYADTVHGSKPLQGNANQAWSCLDLLEVLCQLAERGHASAVRMMLENPLKHCPDVLLAGVSHINTAFNLLQYEVSSTVFPLVFGNAMKSDIINQLWHINPKLVLRGFINIYHIEPESILRILDICQELKILSSVLEIAPFKFSIKLAAYASRKEHINLEKWSSENMDAYKDAFFEECLNFLKEMPFDASNESTNPFQYSDGTVNVHPETSSTLFKVLQAYSGQLISPHLYEEMKRLQAASVHVSPKLQSGDAADSSEEIESIANTYFHQMFNGQLTIEAVVQMLARFKESPEKREQSIFECMIHNLFEEYKFFPKYPEKQLKITAILFGSLIKHQLVSHLTLGIALRVVLDALRKSVDSKMFAFGAKALEQFVDRLVEWPQYCYHLLQISHLRGTHAELVSFIERALVRISSGQSESNGGNNAPTDHHLGSTQSSTENVEASEASWQLIGSGTTQPGQQLSSPLQVQDRQKPSTASLSYVKPPISSSGQPSLGTTGAETVSSQKTTASQSLQIVSSQNPSSGSAAMTSSHGFLRSSRGITSAGMLRQPSHGTGFGSALNIETLVAAAERRDTQIEAPSSETQDKILFMINNISLSNMDTKAKEFSEVLKEHYYPWFAQYMVMKRASIEPNFHDLYLKFLDKVNSRSLNKEIEKATYENCKVLLRSELIKSSSEERSLLKNLGSWLGKFTIGRNQALRARDIDPKVLIVEAYEKGLMIAVIPFTSKILEPCQSSLAYQPPNPWTMGILSLLAEIYALPNLKMNLKFDIEVLFKNLSVNMKDVKPTSLLKDRVREIEGNPDFSNKDISASQTQSQMVAEANSGMLSTLNQVELQSELTNPSLPSGHSNYAAPLHLATSPLGEDDKMGTLSLSERLPPGQGPSQFTPSQSPFSLPTPIPNIGTHVVVNQKLNASLQMQFQRIVPVAMERAIREIMPPVVGRSVTIACRTTKELVVKDYLMETEESRIYNAAHLMVASLAGSLAHVTCKEPLRGAMSNQLRNILQSNIGGELLEHAIQLVTNDNLDLGCAVIEQAATERALQSIDRDISSSLDYRRKPRDGVSSASAFYDVGNFAKSPFAGIPEALRPKPGRLSNTQQRVYEDFVRFPWQNQSTQSSNAVTAGLPGSSGGSASSGLSRVYGSSSGQPNSSIYSTAQMIPGFSTVPQSLDLIPEEMDSASAQFLSAATTHVGGTDAVIQHSAEVSSATPFPSTAAALDVHVMENTPLMKDSGAVVQTLPATSASERLGSGISDPSLTTGDALDKYQIVSQRLESLITKDAREAEIQGVIAEVPEMILKCVSRDEAALAVAQKVFKSLYENALNSIHIVSHLAILAAIRDVCKLVVKELTSWVIYSDVERKFNKDITIGLIRSELLNLAEYNVHLAKLIDGGRNKAATDFAISLVQTLLVQEPVVVSELPSLIDSLAKIAMRPGSPESLQQLIEIARNPTANTSSMASIAIGKEDKARQSRDKKVTTGRSVASRDDNNISESMAIDPAAFRDQVSLLFNEWCRICEHSGTTDAAYTHFISQLQQSGLLKGDDITDRFFRFLMEISVVHCVASEVINPGSLPQAQQQVHNISFIAIDMYAKLVVIILKYSGVDQSNTIILLPKILAVAVRVIQKDAEEKKSSFNPRPYFRLFLNWILDLGSPDPVFDGANFQILTSFANAFHALQPLKVPSWSFAWLELVSHRSFMPKLLMSNSQKGWPFIQRLLVDLFKFMEPYLRNAELGEPIHFLYKGTLRVLLVLLHDFPEFLCDYHFSFCDVIPPTCIQMRNVILSAFPRNMRLPDPSTPNLKIDLLAEISQSPVILSEVDGSLKAKLMKAEVDEYLKTRQQGSPFLAELKQRLLLNPSEVPLAGTKYNVPLINSLVLYVGMQAIQQIQSRPTTPPHAPTPPMDDSVNAVLDIFQILIGDLDTEGRYLFLNAVANQLRYPNNHTHYFSFILLYLFVEAKQEIIQEQITRVLLERLIVNRPHPWGLLITFIELIKNPRYSFWSRSFTRCAPEIERLFESVSRSCGGSKAVDDGMVPGGIPDSTH